MSFHAAHAEVREGDELDVWYGERLLRVRVAWVKPEETTGVVVLTCEKLSEAPSWVTQQILHPEPSQKSPRWWRK